MSLLLSFDEDPYWYERIWEWTKRTWQVWTSPLPGDETFDPAVLNTRIGILLIRISKLRKEHETYMLTAKSDLTKKALKEDSSCEASARSHLNRIHLIAVCDIIEPYLDLLKASIGTLSTTEPPMVGTNIDLIETLIFAANHLSGYPNFLQPVRQQLLKRFPNKCIFATQIFVDQNLVSMIKEHSSDFLVLRYLDSIAPNKIWNKKLKEFESLYQVQSKQTNEEKNESQSQDLVHNGASAPPIDADNEIPTKLDINDNNNNKDDDDDDNDDDDGPTDSPMLEMSVDFKLYPELKMTDASTCIQSGRKFPIASAPASP